MGSIILPATSISQAEFTAPDNKTEIGNRMLTVLAAEAPILKDTLFKKVWSSFGIQKTTAAAEAAEKALKAFKIKKDQAEGHRFLLGLGAESQNLFRHPGKQYQKR